METGDRLADRYVLGEPIASGGMAQVWRGKDEVLGREVAIKVLHEQLAADEKLFERFQREAVTAARLSHPGVVRVFDTGVEAGTCYIVMELYEGPTLADRLAEATPFDPATATDIARAVLGGLAHAHGHGIVHRDVKPANVLIAGGHIKVADFGIAKAAFAGELTTTGELLGTARYLAPEQVEGGEADARADLYAVGVLLYEMLTGRVPFEAETMIAEATMRLTSDPRPPSDLRAGIPRDLEKVVLRALARDPEDRFATAQEMRAALERWTIESTAPLASAPRIPASPEPVSFFRSWMLVPLLLLLLGAAAVAVGLVVGRLELGGPLGVRPAQPSPPRQRVAEPIAIVAATPHDPPPGGGDEHDGEAPLAVDGDPATAWLTEGYESPDLGGIKDGVGLVLDLGGTREVTEVSLVTPNPGWTFELRPFEDGEGGPSLRGTGGEASWTAEGETTVTIEPTEMSAVMIWITELTPTEDGRYRALIAEAGVRGA